MSLHPSKPLHSTNRCTHTAAVRKANVSEGYIWAQGEMLESAEWALDIRSLIYPKLRHV